MLKVINWRPSSVELSRHSFDGRRQWHTICHTIYHKAVYRPLPPLHMNIQHDAPEAEDHAGSSVILVLLYSVLLKIMAEVKHDDTFSRLFNILKSRRASLSLHCISARSLDVAEVGYRAMLSVHVIEHSVSFGLPVTNDGHLWNCCLWQSRAFSVNNLRGPEFECRLAKRNNTFGSW